MRLITYRPDIESAARLGAIAGQDGPELVFDVARLGQLGGVTLAGSMQGLIEQGPTALTSLRWLLHEHASAPAPGLAVPLANVDLLAPIPRPRKNIFGIGLNYAEHVAEASRALDTPRELPTQPVVFSKPPTAVVGDGAPIIHNARITQQLDWEVELAVIIGQRARRVTESEAMATVFGYSIINDISARDCRRAGQWIISKGQDSFAPFGPCIITADAVADPHNLDLSLRVNGVVKQNSNTRHMIFKIAALIADISACMTLEPGDIIATGTPDGVGAGRSPQEWLHPGDVVEARIEGIGILRNPVIAG